MPDTTTANTQVPTGEKPSPKKQLYDKLNKSGLYGKSFEDFSTQFSTPERINKLYTKLNQAGLYGKTAQNFQTQFFGDLPDTSKPATTAPRAVPFNPNDKKFTEWYNKNTLEGQNNVPYDPNNEVYDYYSFFKNKGEGNIKDHFPDTYKRPKHPTFSDESIYSNEQNKGGRWEGETFIPPQKITARQQPMVDPTKPLFPTVTDESLEQGRIQREQERILKVQNAQSIVAEAWKDSDKYARDLLYEKKQAAKGQGAKLDPDFLSSKFYAAPEVTQTGENTNVARFIPPELKKMQVEQEKAAIGAGEVAAVKSDPSTHRAILKKAVIEKKKSGDKETAHKLSAAVYALDSDERDSPQVRENIKAIEKGDLTYNIEKGEVYKPLGIKESIEHGYEERNRANDNGGKLMLMSKADRIKFAEDELSHYDPDKPIPVPGTAAEMIGSEGTAMAKSLSAGAVVSFLTKNPTAGATAAAAASAPEYSRRAYYDEFIRSYAQAKKTFQKQHPEWTEAQLLAVSEEKANANASHAAISDAIVNGIMTYSGLKLGAKTLNVNKIIFDRGALTALKTVTKGTINLVKKGAPEALANAGVGGGAQLLKNVASTNRGLKRDTLEGVPEAAATILTMQYAIAGLHFAGGVANAAKKTLFNAIAKHPIDIVTKATADMLEGHVITPVQADITVDAVKRRQAFAEQFPKVKDDATLDHLENLTEQYNVNEAKLAKPDEGGVHPSLHPAIKEQQKNLEWEINMLSESPENQIKILKTKRTELQTEIDKHDAAKAEGKPGILDDSRATRKQVADIDKQVEAAQEKLDSPIYQATKIIDEDIADDYAEWTQNDNYKWMAQNHPKEFLRFIAEQARGGEQPVTDPDGSVRMTNTREVTVNTFGKQLVKLAEEQWPEPKPAAVIRPGENTGARETITIKPKNNATSEQAPTTVDVRQSSGDGTPLGEGNRLQQTPGEEAPQITGETKEVDLSTPPPDAEGTPIRRLDVDNLNEYTTKTGNQTVRYEKGDLVVTDKNGKAVSEPTRKKALQEYAESFDYSHGERATAPPEGVRTETDVSRHIIESSRNPLEIAELYAMEEPQTAPLSTKERMIADYGIGKIKGTSYLREGDRNNVGMSKAKTYFSKDGQTIDQVAKEMSDHYGVEIGVQDVVDFIDRFPNGSSEALRKVESAVAGEASGKFQELTGLRLNREVAEKAIRQEFDKLTQIEKDLYEANYANEKELQDLYWDTHEATNGFAEDGGNKPGSTEAPGAGTGQGEPPALTTPSGAIHVQHPETILSHRGLQVVANEFGLEDVQIRDRKTDIQLRTDAEQTMRKWAADGTYNNKIENLVVEGERGTIWTDEQHRIMEQHLSNLSEDLRKTPLKSAEFDKKLAGLNRVKKAGEKTRSEAGAALRVSSLAGSAERTYGDFLLREMEVGKVETLTEQEKTTATNEYEKISTKSDEYTSSKAKDEAAATLTQDTPKPKRKSSGKKKTHEDFVTERKQIVESIREKLKKARGESNIVVVPYAKELIAIAPDVVKMARNLVEEGISELSDVVKRIHTDLKDDITELTEKDVHNILAGEYTEKKQTKNEIAERLRNLQTEAKLLNQLEAAQAGEPKAEKAKQKQNQRIAELSKKLKEVNKHHKTDTEIDKAAHSRIEKEITELKAKIAAGDFAKTPKKEVKYSAETEKLRDELYKLRQEREVRLAEKEFGNRSKFDKWQGWLSAPVREVRSIVSAFDLSFPLRQGIIPTVSELVTNPNRLRKRLGRMIRSFGDKKYFDQTQAKLKDNGSYKLMEDSGLALQDPDVVTNRDEVFQSKYAEKIPIIGTYGIKGSERAFANYANSQRADWFMRGVDIMADRGITWENGAAQYKAWANVVNTMTGRGTLIKPFSNSSQLLSLGFFSPRLIASRLAFFNPMFYKNIPKPLRLMVVKDMLKFIAVGNAIIGGAALFTDAEVEYDPRSADFGKIKVGNTRWDIWGGFQQYIRLFSTLATQTKKDAGGKIVPLIEEDGGNKSAGVVGTFLRSKASPAVSALINVGSGETIVGDKTSIGNEAAKFFAPLLWKDVVEVAMQEGMTTATGVLIPGLFGVGSQTYIPKKSTRRATTAGRVQRPQKEKRQRQE